MDLETTGLVFLLLLVGIVTVAWFNRPKTEVKAPEQEVDTTLPVKGSPSAAINNMTNVILDVRKLTKKTKAEIEKIAREEGIELDRRKTKANMIDDFLEKRK